MLIARGSNPSWVTSVDEATRIPFNVLFLLAAVAAGIVAQGGYYPAGRILVAVLVAAALVTSPWRRPWLGPAALPVAAAGAGLAAWAVLRAVAGGTASAGLPTTLTIGCVVAGVLVVQSATAGQRELAAASMVGIGVLVAVSGWLGVAWHWQPWALATDRRLWRACSTLTYANAAAALLAILAILATALLLDRSSTPVRAVAVYLLLVGLGSTLSRGGLLALAAGLVVLGRLAGVRATARVLAAPLLGAGVAVVALAPSFPLGGHPRPVLALCGLAAGLLITVGVSRLPGRVRTPALLAGFVAGTTTFALVAASTHGLGVLADSRANLASPTRWESARAALRLVADHPLLGVGPGAARFSWTTAGGQAVVGRYAHNEYLQVLVELGAVGFVLLLLVLVAAGYAVRRGQAIVAGHAVQGEHPRTRPAVLCSGAVAALTAFLVHSGLDFLWQVPVVPLTGALIVGLAAPHHRDTADSSAVEVT